MTIKRVKGEIFIFLFWNTYIELVLYVFDYLHVYL